MKVAIVHDYLTDYGGAEKVVEAVAELYPEADIYTAVKNEEALKRANAFTGKNIIAPNINGILKPFKKFFIYSYPIYFETLDFSGFDLVVTSTAHFAKGIITSEDTLHICYMHTPTRFLWGLKTETSIRDNWLLKGPLKLADNYLRVWDFAAAQRPDFIITNSRTTQKRINKFYKRESRIIYPFFDTSLSKDRLKNIKPKSGDYYFTVSRAGKYKNLPLIAKTFNKLKTKIYIAGSGSNDPELKKYEGKYVKLLGFVSEKEKVSYLKGCKAFILATENEDFGITPLEAASFGKPAIALFSGGFRETIIPNKTGVFFNKPTIKDLKSAVLKFEKKEKSFNPSYIKKHASNYSKLNFKKEFKNFVDEKLKSFS